MAVLGESVRYSLRNLRARRARSFLTILSIFVGIATIFVFVSFGWGLFDYVDSLTTGSSADKVIIQTRGTGAPGLDDTFQLTEEDFKAIRGVGGVYDVTGASFTVAEVKKSKEKRFNFIVGYDPRNLMLFEISDIEILEGRQLSSGETKKAILGYNYRIADKIFSKPILLNENIEIQGEKVRVVGFLESVGSPPDDAQVYVTKDYLADLYPKTDETYSWIIARVDINNMERVIKDIERAVRKSRGLEEGKEDFFVQSFEELISSFSGALNIIIAFVILIALISVIVSAVNTANTMITSVLERTKEIGVIKSIGARNSEILKIFLFESSALGFLAGFLGVIFGLIVTSAISLILDGQGFGFLSPHYSWTLFIGGILFATITGAVSGVVPALRASRVNIVDSLRYE